MVADGPQPRRRPAAAQPAVQPRHQLAPGHAKRRRRLGRLRPHPDRPLLEHVPFADHNAMQDPSCPDITGRVLECLGHCGFTADHAAVRQAIDFIQQTQDTDGCWFGRWGVNYVYGTWQVLTGLQRSANAWTSRYIRRAADWLRSVPEARRLLGRILRQLRRPVAQRPRRKHPLTNRLGRHGPHGRRRPQRPRRPQSHPLARRTPSATTATGKNTSTPAPASPRSSTSSTTSTGSTSP